MAWVREKHPKRKVSAPTRDPKDALEGFLSYLACKPAPPPNMQRYLRDRSASPTKHQHHEKPEIVPREPTLYDYGEVDDDAPSRGGAGYGNDGGLRSPRTRRASRSQHQGHSSHSQHHHRERDGGGGGGGGGGGSSYSPPPPPPQSTRHVSSSGAEARLYRSTGTRTNVQARRVVSSWGNATTALAI